jgi:glyoxylase-like metal-dependent hydrolase (beta-lactamase superfamily II)
MTTSFSLCATCGVEHAHPLSEVCAICNDERQYLPSDGVQRWTTLEELQERCRVHIQQVEPGLHGFTIEPKVGIGHRPLLAQTLNGNLLWDPPGYIDDDAVEQVRELGGVRWIAASHPHMFGTQLAWSEAFDNAPVLVNAHDQEWIARRGDAIALWDGDHELAPGLRLLHLGGHFPGSAVALWRGQDGAGVMLSSDTIFPVERKGWVTFLRSYPNRLPLSAGTVQRIANRVQELDFDRLYGNFPVQPITAGAKQAVLSSAQRHIAWASGEYDHLT